MNTELDDLLGNIYSSEFIYHMYLDNYFYNGEGNQIDKVLQIFINLLESYNEELKNIFKISLELYYKIINSYYDEYKDFIYDILNKDNKILIPSGYEDDNGGHLVTIYIEKNNENEYSIILTNSGEGRYTFLNKKVNIDNTPVCIKFKYLIKSELDSLLLLIKQSKFYSYLKNNKPEEYYTRKDYLYSKKYNTKKNLRNKYLLYIGEDYIGNNNDIIIKDYFFKNLATIFKEKTKEFLLIDKRQLSGSCTFYGFYYFIKYYIVNKNKNFDIFQNIINEKIGGSINRIVKKNKINPILFQYLYLINKESIINIDLNNDNFNLDNKNYDIKKLNYDEELLVKTIKFTKSRSTFINPIVISICQITFNYNIVLNIIILK